MESFFSRYKNALVLMLVVLAQVVLLAMQVRRPAPGMEEGHNIRLWRYWVASVVTPPERVARGIGLRVRGVWSNYLYLRHLREQNQSLQDENTRLRLEQASLAEDAREGQRLRAMLDFRAAYIDTTVPAQVIGTSGTDQAHAIYIDKGSNDGIKPQMAVITPDGVVGKVKNVFPGTSQVLLISDQTSGAGVMLQTTRIRGVLKGSVSGQPQIINISPDERIQPGEAVLTSGGDQVYPRGLPVGVVEKVVPDPDTSFVNILVKPNANLQKLEEVMVITQVSDKMPFGEEKDMMQSEVDAYAEKERAADILSERLPSLRDAETAESKLAGDDAGEASGESAATAAGSGDPGRPLRPPQPLHPDRYSPGAVPEASELTPGVGPPVKYPASIGSQAAAPKSKSASAAAGGSAGIAGSPTESQAIPKSRFPAKPSVAAPAATKVASGDGSTASAATTTAAKSATGAGAGSEVSGGTGSGATKSAARPAGSGFALPLRPAYPGAGGAGSGAAAASAGGATVARPARPTTGPTPGATTGATTGSANASSGSGSAGGRRAGAGGAAGSAPRRAESSSDSGGILTPAGMGSMVTAPRPRAATPAGGSSSAVAGAASGTARPATPRPASQGSASQGAATNGNGAARPQSPKPAAGTTQQAKPQTQPKPQAPPKPQGSPPGGF
jgi:rod shape-determining protein MreC